MAKTVNIHQPDGVTVFTSASQSTYLIWFSFPDQDELYELDAETAVSVYKALRRVFEVS